MGETYCAPEARLARRLPLPPLLKRNFERLVSGSRATPGTCCPPICVAEFPSGCSKHKWIKSTWRSIPNHKVSILRTRRPSCTVRSVWLMVLIGLCTAARSASFQDEPVKRWSDVFWQGNLQATLATIEQDLSGATPHPYGAMAWCEMHSAYEDLKAALDRVQGTPIGTAVGTFCNVRVLSEEGANRQIIDKYFEIARAHPEDVWLVNSVADAAGAVGRLDDETDLLIASICRSPDQFQLVWQIFDVAGKNSNRRQKVRDALLAGRIAGGSPAALVLEQFVAAPSWGHLERIAAGQLWLQKLPGDPRAEAMVGQELNNLQRFSEAVPLLKASMRAFPFWYSVHSLVFALDRMQKAEDARLSVERFEKGFAADDNQAARFFAMDWASSLRAAGNRGLARQVIDSALKKWPSSASIQAGAGELELADKRNAEAETHFRIAVQLRPRMISYRERLMEAYQNDGQAHEVLSQFAELRTADIDPSLQSYYVTAEADASLKDGPAELTITAEALDHFPNSAWSMRTRAGALYSADEKAAAISLIRKAIDEEPDNEWGIEKWAKWSCEAGKQQDCVSKIESLAMSYPWNESIWQQLIDKAGRPALQIWQEAAAAAPTAGFAGWYETWALEDGDKPDDALSFAQKLPDRYTQASLSDRMLVIGSLAAVSTDLASKRQLSKEQLNMALAAENGYVAAGGDLVRALKWRSALLSALGRRKEAAEASLAVQTLSDDEETFEQPMMDFSAELAFVPGS